MKKFIIIAGLVALLVGSVFGGGALAASRPTGGPLMMEVGGDILVAPSGVGVSNLVDFEAPSIAHVSLTVTVWSADDPQDGVLVRIYFVDKETGDTVSELVDVQIGNGLNIIEFDCARAFATDTYVSWRLVSQNAAPTSDGFSLAYSYTMTYPR